MERVVLARREAEALLIDQASVIQAAALVVRLGVGPLAKKQDIEGLEHLRDTSLDRMDICIAVTKLWSMCDVLAIDLIKSKLPQAIEALYGVPADETKAIIYPLVTEEQIRSLNEETVAFNEMIRLHKATMV